MNLHGVKVFNLHVVILYLCQDHSLNQYKNKYSSLIEHLCNIYFTFRSIYQKQIYGIMQHIYDMENFSPNLQAVSTLLKKKKNNSLLLPGDTPGRLLFLGSCNSSCHYKTLLKEGPRGQHWGCGHHQVVLRKEVCQEQDIWIIHTKANHSQPKSFTRQLQGMHRFSWACVLQHIPRIFI